MNNRSNSSWSQLFTNQAFKSLILKFKRETLSVLPKEIKKDSHYQKALTIFFENNFIDCENPRNIQKQFSLFLINYLDDFKKNHKQNELNLFEGQGNQDQGFLKLNRHQTEQILQEKQNRLLILSASPQITVDCPLSIQNNLPIEIRNHLKLILEKYYPISNSVCPVEYYGDYFQNPISELDIKGLNEIFSSIATVIIYSQITDYQVNFHLAFWTMQEKSLIQISLPTWNWETTFKKLKQKGQPEEEALRNIRKIIVKAYQFIAVFLADFYYLNFNLYYQSNFSKFFSIFPPSWLHFPQKFLENIYQRNQSEIYYQQGRILSQLKKHTDALDYLNKALDLSSTRAEIWTEKGETLLNLKNWPEAIDVFKKSLSLNFKNFKALKGQGIALFHLLFSEEALTYFDQALQLKTDDYEIWTYRGHTLYNLDRVDQALESYEKALSINPNYLEAIKYRSSALHNLGREDKTFTPIRESSQVSRHKDNKSGNLASDSPRNWLDLAQAKVKQEKWEEALHCFDEALKLNPHDYQALKGKGLCLFNLRRCLNAFNCFDQALKIKATNYRLWIYRGKALYFLERFAESIYSYNRALFINPQSKTAFHERQKILKSLELMKLKSDCNIDYTNLRDLLAKQQWKQADIETSKLILQIAQQGKKIIVKLNFKDIEQFPITDLYTLDKLWQIYSGQHFGLTVQKAIYKNFEDNKEEMYDEKRWLIFARKVGWLDGSQWLPYEALTFSTKAPLGHFPRMFQLFQPKMLVFFLLKLEKTNRE
ncbi:tetratricopeptide repeat protein [Gloeothece verrucosa]|uniref:GUN4 domain protein n=1 Tax=Gloeothece verrucosa (strain PCC 7822) TaxID=497965 RepID=E0U6U6_GLOV7|nr:tetratricopeptide repeat protein [Gloeothece verrucosa]ADN15983.1 GUN4 domain protein [Gloeothece verrucosa PCC 7822]